MSNLLAIYYATETGNAEGLARQAETRARRDGWDPRVINLASVTPADLPTGGLALFIVSTWGDGEPPSDACDFWYDLEKADLNLTGLHVAVLGLGDRDYTEFNAFGRNLDRRLAALGAHRLIERMEADVHFDDTYAEWEALAFAKLDERRATASSA